MLPPIHQSLELFLITHLAHPAVDLVDPCLMHRHLSRVFLLLWEEL